MDIRQRLVQAGKLWGKDLHPRPVEGEEYACPVKAAVQLREVGGLAFVLGIVKAQGAKEIAPGGLQAVTEAVSGKAEVAVFLQGAEDRGGKKAQGIFLFLPHGEIFEKPCKPEQIYV